MKLTPLLAGLAIATMLLVAAIADSVVERYPLSDAHWDAPIYLLRARSFLEADVVGDFRAAAAGIHDAVMRGAYSTHYWSFTRLGQTVLLSAVVWLVGTGEGSIYVVTWLYRAVLAVGLFLSAMLAATLVRAVRPGSPEPLLHLGAIASVVLFLLSDVASYMSGNLVSEVPAICLIAVGASALAKSWMTGSKACAVVSGCAGFLLYVVRMESVWLYASLLFAMGWLVTRDVPNRRAGWRSLAISAFIAVLLFAAYSWFFYPLTDPRLVFRYAEAQAKFAAAATPSPADGTALRSTQQLIAASGLLWVGTVLGTALIRTDRLFQFGAVWLGVALVPVAVGMAHSTDTQTRMHTTLVPVLLFTSTLGWAHFFKGAAETRKRGRVAAALLACVSLVLISQKASYGSLRELPGAWRLQYVRPYLAPMPFERISYELPGIVAVVRAIEELGGDAVIIASPFMQAADHIMLVQYLLPGESRGSEGAAALRARKRGTKGESVSLRLSAELDEDIGFLDSLSGEPKVLLLGRNGDEDWARRFDCCGVVRVLATSGAFPVWEFRRTPR